MSSKVLIVDDNQAVLTVAERVLADAGFQVITATRGDEGLQKIREQRPHVVVLDIGLPGMNGLDVCHQVRLDPDIAGTLILMLTGNTTQADVLIGLKVGTDDYVAKPFYPLKLVERVNTLLDRAHGKELKHDADG